MSRANTRRKLGCIRAEAMRPAPATACIVLVCSDVSEADEVGRQLSELNSAYLVTYRRVEDLLKNAPAGKVALMILSTQDDAATMRRTLRWLHAHWPRCPITVVGDAGETSQEIVAREGGACYLTRPVAPEQWNAVLSHVLDRRESQVDIEG